jgi:hypothetical protein
MGEIQSQVLEARPVSLSGLFASPDGKSLDEMSLIAFSLGVVTCVATFVILALAIYVVVFRKDEFHPQDIAGACATIIGAGSTGIGALAGFMGLKARGEMPPPPPG